VQGICYPGNGKDEKQDRRQWGKSEGSNSSTQLQGQRKKRGDQNPRTRVIRQHTCPQNLESSRRQLLLEKTIEHWEREGEIMSHWLSASWSRSLGNSVWKWSVPSLQQSWGVWEMLLRTSRLWPLRGLSPLPPPCSDRQCSPQPYRQQDINPRGIWGWNYKERYHRFTDKSHRTSSLSSCVWSWTFPSSH
jgi:hypothetical protein